MRLYEYEAKNIFRKFGIPVPRGKIASNPIEAREIAAELGKPVMLKAQVLVGGRGKSGGIKVVEKSEDVELEAKQLLEKEIRGSKVNNLLVEEKLDIVKELYLSVTVDRTFGSPVIMASSEGGVEIESVAAKTPEKILMLHPNILKGVREYETRRLMKQIGLRGGTLSEASNILWRLYHIFRVYDCEIVEINPLVVTTEGRIMAADARLNIDDHSLFRHPDLETLLVERFENPLEREGQRRGVNYVDLKGNVAIMGNGAGLVLSLLDAIKMAGGQPACFLDTGGGLSVERVENALDLLLTKAKQDRDVKAIFFAFWFLLSPADEVAEGFLKVMNRSKPQIPIIGVVQGVGADRFIKILENMGIKCYPTIKEGVEAAVSVR